MDRCTAFLDHFLDYNLGLIVCDTVLLALLSSEERLEGMHDAGAAHLLVFLAASVQLEHF